MIDEIDDACPYCGEDMVLSGAIDIDRDSTGAQRLDWRGCCPEACADAEAGSLDWTSVAEMLTGTRPRRVEAGQEVVRGRESDLASTDGLLVHALRIEVVQGGEAQRAIFGLIDTHHRHHDRPVGWHFGLRAWRGDVLVAVAVCGRPVARVLQEQGVVEVTRVCVLDDGDRRLARDAPSAIYRAALEEYRRRRVVSTKRGDVPVSRLVTYTLPNESGASLRGAGFTCEGAAGGGSWDRALRRRQDKAPTTVKVRWSMQVAA